MLRRLVTGVVLLYFIAWCGYFIYSTSHIEATHRVFTNKQVFDGPMVKKDEKEKKKTKLKGKMGKATEATHKFTTVAEVWDGHLVERDKKKSITEGKIIAKKAVKLTLPKLEEDFRKKLVTTANKIAKNESLVYFSLLNDAFKRLTLNWLCNVAEFEGAHKRILIVGTEKKVCDSVVKEWKNVTCLSMNLSGYDGSSDWGSKKYIHMLTLRAQLMNAMVQEGIPFMLFETDSVWLRDAAELFANQTLVDDVDIVVPVKGYNTKWDGLAFSPMLVYPTDGSKHLFKHLAEQLKADSSLYDQDVLNELCLSQYNGVVCRQFEWEEVADGKWFKLSESERADLHPFIVNNNYYVGVKNKESRQALNGLWFLSKNAHCLRTKVVKALRQGSTTGKR